MLILLSIIEDEKERLEIEDLYEMYGKEMHRQAFYVLNDNDDADDAVQNAFIKIWKRLDTLRELEKDSIQWYVLCAAKNSAIDIYRKKKERIEMEEPIDSDIQEIESKTTDISGSDIFEKVAKFPKRERDVLMLRFIYEMQYKEMAMELGISLEAVKKSLFRAKARLLRLCREEGLLQ